MRYLDSLGTSVANKEFDSIIVTERLGVYDSSLIREYYQRETTLSVDMPQTVQKWTIDIWVPIEP